MTQKNCTLIGTDKNYGIKYLVRESDGVDFYYNPKTKNTAMSLSGIARMLNCHHETINSQASKINIGTTVELLTKQGIQPCKIIKENKISETG